MDNLEKGLNQKTNTACLLIQNLNDWFQLVSILTPMKQKFSKIVHTYCIIVHNQSIFWLIPFHKIKVYILHNSESAKVLVPWYLNTYLSKYVSRNLLKETTIKFTYKKCFTIPLLYYVLCITNKCIKIENSLSG